VLSRAKEGGKDILTAQTVVGFRNLRERYTSRAVLDSAARTVDVSQIEGVFRHMETHWRFTPTTAQSCRLEFSVGFEFKSRLLTAVAGGAFALVISRMAQAFEARAKALSEKTAQ
jgi:coenzyme Q-binding protein COQ10